MMIAGKGGVTKMDAHQEKMIGQILFTFFFSLFHIFPTWVFYMIHPMDLFKFEFCPKGLDRTVFKKYYFQCLSEFELREQWDAKKKKKN